MSRFVRLYEGARRQHPAVVLSQEDFERAFEARGAPEARAVDVFLAAAIEAKDPAALEWLVERVGRSARQLCSEATAPADEVESRVIGLVALGSEAGPPRISSYAAKGPLEGWLRAFIARTSIDLGKRARPVSLEAALGSSVSTSPELLVLKGRFREELRAALTTALGRTGSRARSLLTLHYLEGVGLAELGRIYSVHPVTISRWLLSARTEVLDHFRDEVSRGSAIDPTELESVLRAMQSHLDVSWARLLTANSVSE